MTTPIAAISNGRPVLHDSGESFSPVLMLEIELTRPFPELSYDGKYRRAWVLARLHGEPIGTCVIQVDKGGLTPAQLGERLWLEFRRPVSRRFVEAGMAEPVAFDEDGLEANPAVWPYLLRQRGVLAAAPFVSVVICTRDRVDRLERCLNYLDQQQYPAFEVVVVDNAPTSDAVHTVVKARQGKVPYRYVVEPRGGLSWARNAGILAASGEIIAFLDDDEAPDRHWLAGLAGGFDRGDDIGCVTGMIVPNRLDTPVQWWFELVGGHSKGRGFSAAIFSQDGPQSPLYPLPPFGAGGNMAFRRQALKSIGNFDVALGTGTPACAAEDTLALTLVLLAGYRIAYEPAALVRHDHYADRDGLARQLYGYGVGLTAFYTALLRHRPGVFPALLRLLPSATNYFRKVRDAEGKVLPDFPVELRRRQRKGMIAGPVAYARSIYKQSRIAALDT
jgi:GT2 family glycosyltransferase